MDREIKIKINAADSLKDMFMEMMAYYKLDECVPGVMTKGLLIVGLKMSLNLDPGTVDELKRARSFQDMCMVLMDHFSKKDIYLDSQLRGKILSGLESAVNMLKPKKR